tara:strand:+ start:3681 stop:3950 length:270 start_codon:yes stop_codon:yes gene_type:complete
MKENITETWFNWFYKNWEEYSPGDLLDKGLLPIQIAEGFINDNQKKLYHLANTFDDENRDALDQFMRLSESELHIVKYFLKIIKLKNIK